MPFISLRWREKTDSCSFYQNNGKSGLNEDEMYSWYTYKYEFIRYEKDIFFKMVTWEDWHIKQYEWLETHSSTDYNNKKIWKMICHFSIDIPVLSTIHIWMCLCVIYIFAFAHYIFASFDFQSPNGNIRSGWSVYKKKIFRNE